MTTPPNGTKTAGRRLWHAVTDDYDLAGHELVILGVAVRVADRVDDLAAIVAAEGVIEDGRAHPAAIEFRQQAIALARLVSALRLPDTDAGARTQHRGNPWRLRRGRRVVSRLRAGRHVGTVTDSQACELIFAWGGQCRSEAHHFTGCDGIGCWSKFDSDEDREAAWLAMRDELIYLPNPGSRPAAFWYYESAALCRHDPPCPRWPRDQSGWLQARRLPPAALADARELGVTYTTGDWPFDESMRHWLDRT